MQELSYKLVINGVREGQNLSLVRSRLLNNLRYDSFKVDNLFSSLQKGLDFIFLDNINHIVAHQFKSELEAIGFQCTIEASLTLVPMDALKPGAGQYTCPLCGHVQLIDVFGHDQCSKCGVSKQQTNLASKCEVSKQQTNLVSQRNVSPRKAIDQEETIRTALEKMAEKHTKRQTDKNLVDTEPGGQGACRQRYFPFLAIMLLLAVALALFYAFILRHPSSRPLEPAALIEDETNLRMALEQPQQPAASKPRDLQIPGEQQKPAATLKPEVKPAPTRTSPHAPAVNQAIAPPPEVKTIAANPVLAQKAEALMQFLQTDDSPGDSPEPPAQTQQPPRSGMTENAAASNPAVGTSAVKRSGLKNYLNYLSLQVDKSPFSPAAIIQIYINLAQIYLLSGELNATYQEIYYCIDFIDKTNPDSSVRDAFKVGQMEITEQALRRKFGPGQAIPRIEMTQILDLANSISDPGQRIQGLSLFGKLFAFADQYVSAKMYFEFTIEKARIIEGKEKQVSSLSVIAKNLALAGYMDASRMLFDQAYAVNQSIHEIDLATTGFSVIALNRAETGDNIRARELLASALDDYFALARPVQTYIMPEDFNKNHISTLSIIGKNLSLSGDQVGARQYFTDALVQAGFIDRFDDQLVTVLFIARQLIEAGERVAGEQIFAEVLPLFMAHHQNPVANTHRHPPLLPPASQSSTGVLPAMRGTTH
jgi:hypothetical protein